MSRESRAYWDVVLSDSPERPSAEEETEEDEKGIHDRERDQPAAQQRQHEFHQLAGYQQYGGQPSIRLPQLQNPPDQPRPPELAPIPPAPDRAFICEQCGSSFRWKKNYKVHVRVVHDGSRPYKCEECGTSFGTRSNLSKHIKLVHERERRYECPICHKLFGQRHNMTSHMKTHERKGETRKEKD